MAEPKDMIIPMLREMRKEMSGFQDENRKEFKEIKQHLERIDSKQKSFNDALTADTMMGRLVTGDFESRIEALEKQVAQLMSRS